MLMASILLSCGDDGKSLKLDIVFKATYEDQPLVIFDEVDYADTKMFFSQADFYVSEIKFGNQLLSDVEFVDFTNENKTQTGAEEGIKFSYALEPDSDASGTLSFGIGVDPNTNAQTPSEFSSDNPLSNTGYYWEAWNSYIFMKLQGQYDTNKDDTFPLGFLFHTGKDELYRNVQSTKTYTIAEDVLTIEIELDFKKLFETTNGLFDIPSNPVNHDPLNIEPIRMIADNLSGAIRSN